MEQLRARSRNFIGGGGGGGEGGKKDYVSAHTSQARHSLQLGSKALGFLMLSHAEAYVLSILTQNGILKSQSTFFFFWGGGPVASPSESATAAVASS